MSYLNAKPLIYGLAEYDDLQMSLDVPAKLIDGLRDHRFDIALLPVIDYQRLPGLKIVPSGGIGSDGPTLTVRIFSKVPISKIHSLACDTDSHTSVALARIILAELFSLRPEFMDLNRVSDKSPEALLLIGDKVVCEEPEGYSHQLDLGEAWKKLTGLPFVFAVWMARGNAHLADLPERLSAAKTEGLKHVREIVEQFAVPRGWPVDLAIQYLTENLKFDISEKQFSAIRKFHQLAAKHGLISNPPVDLQFYEDLTRD